MVKSTGVRNTSRQIKADRSILDLPREAKMTTAIQDIMDKAIIVLANEIGKISKKSENSTVTSIGAVDIANLQKCTKCAVDLSRELRELEKNNDYSDMSDEEIKRLFDDAQAALDAKDRV